MRTALCLLLLLAAAPARAFLFGRSADADADAAARLGEMRATFEKGDCAAVLAASDTFLGTKPPAEMREEAFGYMGRCYEASGSTDKAISLYQLAQGLYPENTLFASRLALIYNGAGFPENAAPLFLKVLALKADDLEANLGLARSYSALGFLARSAEFYAKAAELQGYRDPALLEEYARCLLRKRDWAGAEAAAVRGRAVTPRSAAWPAAEARASAGRGEYFKAVEAMDAAIRYESNRRFRLERALYLLLGGLPRRAVDAAEEELKLDPEDALASQVKGMALYALGRRAEAGPYFTAALKGGPFTAAVAGAFLGGGATGAEATCKK
ncbi:MAG: tetratricopeptide repeat protein [Elusimicrobiales bacterium]|nr:tetratricopeptide repeat protein [Elusimicrobiales bacterium]